MEQRHLYGLQSRRMKIEFDFHKYCSNMKTHSLLFLNSRENFRMNFSISGKLTIIIIYLRCYCCCCRHLLLRKKKERNKMLSKTNQLKTDWLMIVI